jgi:hypothetical protein
MSALRREVNGAEVAAIRSLASALTGADGPDPMVEPVAAARFV